MCLNHNALKLELVFWTLQILSFLTVSNLSNKTVGSYITSLECSQIWYIWVERAKLQQQFKYLSEHHEKVPFYYIGKAFVILNRTALYVQKPLKSCQNWSKSKPLQCFWSQMSSDIYARKVSIKIFLEKLLETYVSKTSRKKSLRKQKL